MLAEIFRRIGVGGGGFCEFGVQDGTEGNTVFLAQVLGWRGAYLEADEASFAALERRFAGNPRVATVHAAVEPDTVEALFDRAGRRRGARRASRSTSTATTTGSGWRSRRRPRVVVVEYNGALDVGSKRVMPYSPGHSWDHTSGYGASLGALEALGADKGYRLVHTELAGVNAFFVREDLAGGLPSGDAVPRRSANHALMGLDHPAPRGDLGW